MSRRRRLPLTGWWFISISGEGEVCAKVSLKLTLEGGERMRTYRDRLDVVIAKLLELPEAHRELHLRSNPVCQTFALGEELLARAWALRFEDPAMMEILAALGREIGRNLSGASGRDLEARAWLYRAQANNIQSQYQTAEKYLAEAKATFQEGTGSALFLAEIHYVQASLRIRQERYEEALELQELRIEIYRQDGNPHLQGLALTDKAAVYHALEQYAEAIAAYGQGLPLMDPERDPQAYLNARSVLALTFFDAERVDEAVAEMEEIVPLAEKEEDRLTLARCNRLQGMIAAEYPTITGMKPSLSLAVHYYQAALEEFVAQGIGLDAAEVALELCLIYEDQKRRTDIFQLAEKIIPIFTDAGLPRQAIVTLRVWMRAIQDEQLDAGIVERCLAVIRGVRDNPEFPEPTAHDIMFSDEDLEEIRQMKLEDARAQLPGFRRFLWWLGSRLRFRR